MKPGGLAVQVRNGVAEYRTVWVEESDEFCWAIYTAASRANAEEYVRQHAETENLLGGLDRLCLYEFAQSTDGDEEYFVLHLVDSKKSGLRCISLSEI